MCVCVRHGSFLVHTHVDHIPEVIASLSRCHGGLLATTLFADHADQLMQAHVDGHPEARPRGLRDVIFARRYDVGVADLLLMKQIQSAATLTRHVAVTELQQKVMGIAALFRRLRRRDGAPLRRTTRMLLVPGLATRSP